MALRGLRNDEIEYLAGEAAVFQDVCRTYSWAKEATLQRTDLRSVNMTFDVKFPNVLKRNCKRLSCLTGKQCKAHTSVSLKYADLCAGGQKYTQKFHKLQCDNWSPHPSFYLQPIRREWLNKRPNVSTVKSACHAKFCPQFVVENLII